MREPFPKEWLIDAWNARVGAVGDRYWIHRALTMMGNLISASPMTCEVKREQEKMKGKKRCLSQNYVNIVEA